MVFALASCLGGAPNGFHVEYQSDRHFCFSVANKAVGFHVYSLRRFIADHFDAYFHLWRDGSANWEKEKRPWELEQQRHWTEVINKHKKCKAKSSKKVTRKISSPKPSPVKSLFFGQFKVQVPQLSDTATIRSFRSLSRTIVPCSLGDLIIKTTCKSESSTENNGSAFGKGEKSGFKSVATCSNCLSPGHLTRS